MHWQLHRPAECHRALQCSGGCSGRQLQREAFARCSELAVAAVAVTYNEDENKHIDGDANDNDGADYVGDFNDDDHVDDHDDGGVRVGV